MSTADLLQAPCSLQNYKCNIPPPYSKKCNLHILGEAVWFSNYIYPPFLNALFPYPQANCLIKNCYITTPFIAIFIIITFVKTIQIYAPPLHQTMPFLGKGHHTTTDFNLCPKPLGGGARAIERSGCLILNAGCRGEGRKRGHWVHMRPPPFWHLNYELILYDLGKKIKILTLKGKLFYSCLMF